MVLLYDHANDKMGASKFEPMWHGPYIIKHVLQKGAYELIDYEGNPLEKLRNGIYFKKVLCLGHLAWLLLYNSVLFIFVQCSLVCFFQATCLLIIFLPTMQMSVSPHISFTNGACYSIGNISSTSWAIYNPRGELINL